MGCGRRDLFFFFCPKGRRGNLVAGKEEKHVTFFGVYRRCAVDCVDWALVCRLHHDSMLMESEGKGWVCVCMYASFHPSQGSKMSADEREWREWGAYVLCVCREEPLSRERKTRTRLALCQCIAELFYSFSFPLLCPPNKRSTSLSPSPLLSHHFSSPDRTAQDRGPRTGRQSCLHPPIDCIPHPLPLLAASIATRVSLFRSD